MDKNIILPESFYKIIKRVVANRSYGSVEIVFQSGEVTQITERTINKVGPKEKKLNGEQLLRAV